MTIISIFQNIFDSLLYQSLFHIAMNSSAGKYHLYSYEKMFML